MSQDHPSYVTVTSGMRGFFAVLLTWNEDHGGFYEPWNSGIGSYENGDDAWIEARQWAEAEGIEAIRHGCPQPKKRERRP